MAEKLKKCSKCERWLSKEFFHRDKYEKDGLVCQCKDCRKKHSKQYREENADKVKKYNKQYYKENADKEKERRRQYSRQYYKENADKMKKYNKKYREENADKVKKYNKKYREENADKVNERSRQYQKESVSFDTYAPQLAGIEAVQKSEEGFLEVKCTYCGKWFKPTNREVSHRVRCLDGQMKGECRFYCSDKCKEECSIYGQQKYPKGYKEQASPREVQSELRTMVFERDNYTCQKCGKHQDELEYGLHCHHKEGIHWEPLESADIDMCITTCKKCHIAIHKKPGCRYVDMQCDI